MIDYDPAQDSREGYEVGIAEIRRRKIAAGEIVPWVRKDVVGRATVYQGDSREVIRALPDASVDSCVTDPPYALVSIVKRFGADGAAPAKAGKTGAYARASSGFMGKKWDTGETAFDPEFWREVLRVMKPGAHLLAFGGTRTDHRLACAIEDAGFEIRDKILWLYGTGFPKSHDVAKSIDKAARGVPHGGADPTSANHGKFKGGCTADNPRGQGFGAGPGAFMATSGERVDRELVSEAQPWIGWGAALKPACEPIILARKPLIGTVAANVLQHGTGAINIDGCRVGSEERMNGAASPTSMQRKSRVEAGYRHDDGVGPGADAAAVVGRWPANVIHDGSDEVLAAFPQAPGQQRDTGPQFERKADVYGKFAGVSAHVARGDQGSAARFFYSAKATASDRLGSKHPTVKPVDLMRYLCRLVTPPGGLVLDPFAGSGTTGMACMAEGFDAILIEREAEYVEDINRRLAHVIGADEGLFAEASTNEPPAIADLFGSAGT